MTFAGGFVSAILLFIGAAIITYLAVIGGVTLLDKIERHFAIRAGLKRLNETLSDRADGDWPAVPGDFKAFHGGEK